MKSILKFIKTNKVLTIGVIISLIIFVSYELTMDLPEIIPYGDFIFNLASQLSLAYMGSFIFYIMQVYIPEENNKTKLVPRLKIKLNLIESSMRTPLEFLVKTYLGKNNLENISQEEFYKISLNLNLSQKAPMIKYGTMEYCNIHEYILEYISNSDKYIMNIFDTMTLNMDVELIEILDSINQSNYHGLFKVIPKQPCINLKMQQNDKTLYSYYELYLKLKKYIEAL